MTKPLKFKNVRYNDKIIACVTIGQLSKMCNREVVTMRKLEDRNILPLAVIRGKTSTKKNGDSIPGRRLYSVKLAERLVEILKDVRQGVAITNEQRRQILLAFQNERMFICGHL